MLRNDFHHNKLLVFTAPFNQYDITMYVPKKMNNVEQQREETLILQLQQVWEPRNIWMILGLVQSFFVDFAMTFWIITL